MRLGRTIFLPDDMTFHQTMRNFNRHFNVTIKLIIVLFSDKLQLFLYSEKDLLLIICLWYNKNRIHLLELGFAAFLFFCGCYDFMYGKHNYFIYLFLQTISFTITGFGYVGTIVPSS